MSDEPKVTHKTFGEGVVLEARYTGGTISETLVVDFGEHGVRQVLVSSLGWLDRDAAETAFDRISEEQARPKRRCVRKVDPRPVADTIAA